VLIISQVPRKSRYNQEWTDELPGCSRRTLADEIAEMTDKPRFEGAYPTEPVEPKPERPVRIKYPDLGIV
jgi:hypothetical protein